MLLAGFHTSAALKGFHVFALTFVLVFCLKFKARHHQSAVHSGRRAVHFVKSQQSRKSSQFLSLLMSEVFLQERNIFLEK